MKILIIDDDTDSRNLLQEFLTPYGICHLAANGAEALIAVDGMIDRKDPYRLICLDIMMPGMDGPEILKKIRELERQRRIGASKAAKIIMTTAMDDPKNRMKALVRGASNGCLTKPLDPTTMRKLLADLGLKPLSTRKTSPA
jgi:two-component system chemotaxis response regulator CheY